MTIHMNMTGQELINKAIIFATKFHAGQTRKSPEETPYIFHPFDVANEVLHYSGLQGEERLKAAALSILHDTVEDTDATLDNIEREFGLEMREDVAAISKNDSIENDSEISRENSLRENLKRILQRTLRVAVAKLADRISNLKVFPDCWSKEKIEQYLYESQIIADTLGHASSGLHARLITRIHETRIMLSLYEKTPAT